MATKKKPQEIDLAAMESEYIELRPIIDQFHKGIRDQIDHIVSSSGIILGTPMQSRVKEWPSLSQKLETIRARIENVRDVQDLVGVRLILLFKRDMDRVVDVVAGTFKIVEQYGV